MFGFEIVFFVCLATLVYVYAGFPLLLLALTGGRRRQPPPDLPDSELPRVVLITAAFNEELVIEHKVRNSLAIDYPADKLRFLFVSDSTDGTNGILLRCQSDRVHVKILPERRGKVHALHAAFQICDEDIIVLSDANTYYQPDSIRKLVRHFADPAVGLVTGDVRILPTEETFGEGEGLYYKYERGLQLLETSFWSTVAIDGAMYALRRELLRPPTSGLVADDLVTSMNVGCQGFRMLYDPEAIAVESATPDSGMEYRRKVRVVAYAVQSLMAGEGVPPLKEGRLLWTYLSHKILRWFAPVFLIGMLASAAAAAPFSTFWAAVFAAQVLFYLLAVLTWKIPSLDHKLFRVPYYFTMVNYAALLGLLRGLRRKQKPVWVRTDRLSPESGTSPIQ